MDRAAAQAAFLPAARAALEAFPIEPATIAFANLSENVTFRVTDARDGATYVLRLHRPWYHGLEALKAERVWTRALAASGVAVPEPVTTRDGQDYVQVAVAATGERRHAGLARWIEGKVLAEAMADGGGGRAAEGHFERLGAMMAAMHNQASAWTPPAGFVRHAVDADGLMGEAPFWGPFWDHPVLSPAERSLLLATRDRLRAALIRYGRDPATFSLIHADLHPGNVLIDGERLAVIDFDDTAFGWHLYDLAVALRAYDDDADYPLYRDACLRGYCRVRRLPTGALELLPMFLLIRALAQLGWMHQRPELPPPPNLRDMKALIVAAAEGFTEPC
jgi:Ser/Thr protein kinase RdoA (MazF antagonist)